MIDLEHEHLIPVTTARDMLPSRDGKPVSKAGFFRWRKYGVNGVKLEVLRIGGTTFTSREAIQRFIERQNESLASPQPNSPRKDVDAALKKFGVT